MISAIQKSNYVIPPATKKPQVEYSPVNFSAKPENQKKESHWLLWSVLGAGALTVAGVLIHKHIKVNKVENKLEQEVRGLYDKAWEYTSNCFDKDKIKIEKPELKYFSEPDSKSYGHYNPANNIIKLNLDKFEKMEFLVHKGKGEKIEFMETNGFPLLSSKDIEKLKKEGVLDNTWTIKKASHSEKLFALGATIAHEQRHCAQYHLILNDSDFGADYLLRDIAAKTREQNPKVSEEEAMKLARNLHPYWANFKPKSNVNKLTLRLPARLNGQSIGLSTAHFVKNHATYTTKDMEEYLSNTFEVDARAFSWAFLKIKENQKGVSDEVLAVTLAAQKNKNVEDLKEFAQKHNIGK